MPMAYALLLAGATAQATPATRPPSAYRVSVTPVKPDQRRDVSIEIVKGCIVLEARVNGRTVWMLIDNGAARSFIDSTLAREIGLAGEAGIGEVRTPTGRMPKRIVQGVQLDIPGQFTSNEAMYAVDLKPMSTRYGRNVGVVIGHDLLSFMAVGVNALARTLFFEPGSLRVDAPAVNSLSVVPIERDGDEDLVTVQVDGKDLKVQLDLGYGGSLQLTPDALLATTGKVANGRTGHLVGANGSDVAITKATVTSLGVGRAHYDNVESDVGPIDSKEIQGVLGAGILTRQQFLLDLKAGKLYLQPY